MTGSIIRSTSVEALNAEIHRSDLIAEAAAHRRARAALASGGSTSSAPGLLQRLRLTASGLGRTRPVDCPECA
jgi:hypothetical protein